jgi:CubicO group peptidase (beta-lactamase class C family)
MTNICRVGALVFMLAVLTGRSEISAEEGKKSILLDARRLEEAVDRIVTNRMEKAHVPGAVVTIVKGNKIVFNKGYGFANLEKQRPVDPDRTLFRVASVSKVFNAMAALTLVDRGLIDVNEDVRRRLAAAGLALDKTVDGPITLKGLLTHTAGIRELYIPNVTLTTNRGDVLPLAAYLQKCLPLRWQPPGETVLYSDHGITVAGYLVEIVSGKKFQDYVVEKVMEPLGMDRTRYEVPAERWDDVAVAYAHDDSGYKPEPFEYTSIDPPIGVLTTGRDMGRMIIEHLAGARHVLKPRTAKLMHEAQYSDEPRFGIHWTCGLWQLGTRENPNLLHFGGAYGFFSQMQFLPGRDLGYFVAQNNSPELVFHIGDLDSVLGERPKRTKRDRTDALVPISHDKAHLEALAGTYVGSRNLSRRRPLNKEEYVQVKYAKDIHGIEVAHWQNREKPMRFVETAPLFFRSTNSNAVSFRRSRDGQRLYMFDFNFGGDGQFTRIATSDGAN